MKYILKIIIIPFSIFSLYFFSNTASAETNIGILEIKQGETQTWESTGNPYIVNETVYIQGGGKLVIKENVVAKFKKNAILYVEGELQVKGKSKDYEKVVFTSYNDKEFYPEFSGPDNPQPADWIGVEFGNNSQGNIQGLTIIYGDAMIPSGDPPPDPIPGDDYNPEHSGAISVNQDAYVLIQNSIITKNYGGVSNNRGIVDISNSEIYGNLEYGIWNYNDQLTNPPNKIQAINNWWGYNSGPKHQTLNPNGEGNRVHSTVIFDPWQLRNPPVIIIPGILGSWQNAKGEWQLDPIFHTYDNLVSGFKSQDYKENKDLFLFPYDWHNSNIDTVKLLKDKIQEAKEKGKSPRVDIVAHSMGGLISRQYIESDDYQNDVFHLVTLGTPHKGSPESYLMWEGGIRSAAIIEDFKRRILEKFANVFFLFEARQAGYNTLYKYIREKVPSVKELLPVYDYLRDAETKEMKSYPEGYPRNEFLDNLNSEENILNKFFRRPNLEVANLAGVEDKNNTVDIIRVIDLPEKFKNPENLLWPHGYPEGLEQRSGDHGLELDQGDGTVPLKSIIDMGPLGILPYSHHQMATETFDKVFYLLTNTNPINPLPIRRQPPKRLLFFRLHSPVDFQIIDPAGNKIGKDFASNAVINQITDAFYSGFNTDTEFITIPDPIDGEYKIITQGTDNGSFELTISSIDEEKTDEQSYQSTTQPNQEDNLKVEYSQNKEHPLKPITSTNEEYTIDDLTVKLKDYYKNNSIKDRYIYHYFKHLLRGVEIGVKRISQVQEEIEEINQRLQEPNLKPHKKEVLEYRKWLYQQRIIFHQTIIKRNLTTFINKINQYQPNLIEPEAANDLIKTAQAILARYE